MCASTTQAATPILATFDGVFFGVVSFELEPSSLRTPFIQSARGALDRTPLFTCCTFRESPSISHWRVLLRFTRTHPQPLLHRQYIDLPDDASVLAVDMVSRIFFTDLTYLFRVGRLIFQHMESEAA